MIFSENMYINNINLLPPLGMISLQVGLPVKKAFFIHKNYHINYILDGELEYCFKKEVIIAKAGQAIIIPPNYKYTVSCTQAFKKLDIIPAVWNKNSEWVWKHIVNLCNNGYVVSKPIKFESNYYELKNLFSVPTDINYIILQNKCEQIMVAILEQFYKDEKSEFVKKIENINLFENPKISLADLCEYTGYSQTHFERLMLQHFGCSGIEYFNRIKGNLVCRLLRTTDMTISQIAEETGFYDSSHLNTFFKKRFGTTPGKYRKQIVGVITDI